MADFLLIEKSSSGGDWGKFMPTLSKCKPVHIRRKIRALFSQAVKMSRRQMSMQQPHVRRSLSRFCSIAGFACCPCFSLIHFGSGHVEGLRSRLESDSFRLGAVGL